MRQDDYIKTIEDSVKSTNESLNIDILKKYGIVEYTVDDIIKEFEDSLAYKQEQAKVFKILDAADHSDIWKIYNRKIPYYVQTPVNNPITIIKEATKASIMPTSYSAIFRPESLAAKEICNTANKYFNIKWDNAKLDSVNSDAANYAYLHGTSGVLFGWNDNIIDGLDALNVFNNKCEFQAKAYHPSNIFPDPSASKIDEMNYLFFAERKSKNFLRSIPRFAPVLNQISAVNDSFGNLDTNYILDKSKQSINDVVTFLTCYKKVFREQIDAVTGIKVLRPSIDIIYLAGRTILDVSKDIQPSVIPFVPLYDEQVPNNFWGISKCKKVLSMVITLNQLDSTEATAYFRDQNPTEFVNALSGLNIAEYQSKRNNPDTAFLVNCDPKIVQAYATRPDIPKNLDTFRSYLLSMIQQVSGVDSIYLGRDYGSIQTTGGISQAINRATLRDVPRIKEIDNFIKKEVELMVQFYISHGKKEKFFPYSKNHRDVDTNTELEFDPIQLLNRSDIRIDVNNSAPRSNDSYEEAAMKLMELQMKYLPAEKGYPDFITPEELISWLNIPQEQKIILTERMSAQMQTMKLEEYTAVLTAIGTLTQGGMPVEDALMEVVKQMERSVGQLPATNPNPGASMPR